MNKIQTHSIAKGNFYDVYTAGDTNQRTLYLIGSYKGVPAYFRRFIHKMARRKYRVVYLQPCPQVLSTRHPQWLGQAIDQAVELIDADKRARNDESAYLMGVSLGSYLGLNVQLRTYFKKFVVVAGGAPLNGVYRSVFMFWRDRRRLKKQDGGFETLESHWIPYDEAFKQANLSGRSTLFINTKNDRIISVKNFESFLGSYAKTGVTIDNRLKGYATHSMEVLSVNFRAKEIDDYLRS